MSEQPTPDELADSLRHAADDHPCCKVTLIAAAEMLEKLERERDEARKERDALLADQINHERMSEKFMDERDEAMENLKTTQEALVKAKAERVQALRELEFVCLLKSFTPW